MHQAHTAMLCFFVCYTDRAQWTWDMNTLIWVQNIMRWSERLVVIDGRFCRRSECPKRPCQYRKFKSKSGIKFKPHISDKMKRFIPTYSINVCMGLASLLQDYANRRNRLSIFTLARLLVSGSIYDGRDLCWSGWKDWDLWRWMLRCHFYQRWYPRSIFRSSRLITVENESLLMILSSPLALVWRSFRDHAVGCYRQWWFSLLSLFVSLSPNMVPAIVIDEFKKPNQIMNPACPSWVLGASKNISWTAQRS